MKSSKSVDWTGKRVTCSGEIAYSLKTVHDTFIATHDTFIATCNSDLVVGDMTLQQDVSSFVVMRMTSEYGDTFEELAFLGENGEFITSITNLSLIHI